MKNEILNSYELPMYRGCGIWWKKCIGKTLRIRYKENVYELIIEKVEYVPKCKNSYITFNYNGETQEKISTAQIKNMGFKNIFNPSIRLVDYLKETNFRIDYKKNEKELGLTKEFLNNLTKGSEEKIYFKCIECGLTFEKPKRCADLTKKGRLIKCPFCANGLSLGESIMRNLLSELNEEYICELNKSKEGFEWCRDYRYDFYLKKYNSIIEIYGEQHYKENTNWTTTLQQQQQIDVEKMNIALKNNIYKYIIIDCRMSDFEFIKENILKSELNNIIDLSNIDWNCIGKRCMKSTMIEVCKEWNKVPDTQKSTKELAEKYNTSDTQIRRYLKIGTDLGLCSYNSEILKKNRSEKAANSNKKHLYYAELNGKVEKFNSISEISEHYNVNRDTIFNLIKSKKPYKIFFKNTRQDLLRIEGLIIKKIK